LLNTLKDAKFITRGLTAMNTPDQIIMTFDEFLSEAQKNDLFQQVAKEIAQEQKETNIVDSSARRDEEWGILANQVVGRENFRLA